MNTQQIRKIRQAAAKAYSNLLKEVPKEITENDMVYNYFLCELIRQMNNDLTKFLQEDMEKELNN